MHHVCGYDDADELFGSGEVDAIYIALPNAMHRKYTEPSGEEGLADVRVIEALNRSIQTGKWVSPQLPQRRRRPTLRQEIRRPGIQPPSLVGGVHSAST